VVTGEKPRKTRRKLSTEADGYSEAVSATLAKKSARGKRG
jgi:hypothetical protein